MNLGRSLLRSYLLPASLLLPVLLRAAEVPLGAPRSMVPILCTDSYQAAHTHARGTGIVIDHGGKLLTAAHVVAEHQLYCDLTVLIPDKDWSQSHGFQSYSVRDCVLSIELDLALCTIFFANHRAAMLQTANLRFSFPKMPMVVSATGFTGWGLSPVSRSGLLHAGNYFRRQEECYCDFSMELIAFEGMSGGPITNSQGEVIGILTAVGTGKFHGLAFGVSLEKALEFLQHQGLRIDQRDTLQTKSQPPVN